MLNTLKASVQPLARRRPAIEEACAGHKAARPAAPGAGQHTFVGAGLFQGPRVAASVINAQS